MNIKIIDAVVKDFFTTESLRVHGGMMKQGDKITVTFDMKVPADCTPDELGAWLDFELGVNGSLNSDNPCLMARTSIQADRWPGIDFK